MNPKKLALALGRWYLKNREDALEISKIHIQLFGHELWVSIWEPVGDETG